MKDNTSTPTEYPRTVEWTTGRLRALARELSQIWQLALIDNNEEIKRELNQAIFHVDHTVSLLEIRMRDPR